MELMLPQLACTSTAQQLLIHADFDFNLYFCEQMGQLLRLKRNFELREIAAALAQFGPLKAIPETFLRHYQQQKTQLELALEHKARALMVHYWRAFCHHPTLWIENRINHLRVQAITFLTAGLNQYLSLVCYYCKQLQLERVVRTTILASTALRPLLLQAIKVPELLFLRRFRAPTLRPLLKSVPALSGFKLRQFLQLEPGFCWHKSRVVYTHYQSFIRTLHPEVRDYIAKILAFRLTHWQTLTIHL